MSTDLMFKSCEKRQCTNITIMNDVLVESTESFFVTLERTPDLDTRITLDPEFGEIEITDGLFCILFATLSSQCNTRSIKLTLDLLPCFQKKDPVHTVCTCQSC